MGKAAFCIHADHARTRLCQMGCRITDDLAHPQVLAISWQVAQTDPPRPFRLGGTD